MPKFLIFALDMEKDLYFKASLTIDIIMIVLTLLAYFSDELIISFGMDLATIVISAMFSAILVSSTIKYIRESENLSSEFIFKCYFFSKCVYLIFLFIMSCIIFHRIDKSVLKIRGFLFVSIFLFFFYLINALSVKGLYELIILDRPVAQDEYVNVQNDFENDLEVDN